MNTKKILSGFSFVVVALVTASSYAMAAQNGQLPGQLGGLFSNGGSINNSGNQKNNNNNHSQPDHHDNDHHNDHHDDHHDNDHHNDNHWNDHNNNWNHNTPAAGGSCSAAPANVAKVESQIDALMATPEFASASAVKERIAAIRGNTDATARAADYMALAGISSPQQFAELLGNDTLRQKYVLEMSAQYELTAAQANALIEAIETGLLGDLE